MCEIERNRIVILTHKANEILIYNEEFVLEQQIKDIDGYKFRNPVGLCMDDTGETLCICDYNADKVLLVDKKFKRVKCLIDKTFYKPVDAKFHRGLLYVIEHRGKCVQIFTRDGEFVEKHYLYSDQMKKGDYDEDEDPRELIKGPIRIACCEDTMAVIDDWCLIYIYNLKAELKHVIKPDQNVSIETLIFINGYLIVHSGKNESRFICYECGYRENQEQVYTLVFNRLLSPNRMSSSYMATFNGRLVLGFCDAQKLHIF